jgi:hypothetical protein
MPKLIVIDEHGIVDTLYDDTLPNLGHMQILRASCVEYCDGPDAGWTVQLSKIKQNGVFAGMYLGKTVNGECTGTVPKLAQAQRFSSRAMALAAEVFFIQTYILGGDGNAKCPA